MIVGFFCGIVAVAVAWAFAMSGPMLFAAYVGGGAFGIIVAAGVVLVLRMARARMPVGSSTGWTAPQISEAADLSDARQGGAAGTAATVVYLPEYRVAAERALFRRNQPDRKRAPGGYGWPEQPPEGLRLALLDLLSYERVAPEDIWDELQDWLERNEAQCPTDIKTARDSR